MGVNKALLDFGGKPLISVLIDRILPVTSQIIISSNDCISYGFLNFPVVPDYFPGHGPLAGFHSAMTRNEYSLYIILACDLPNLKTGFLRKMVSLAKGFDAVIPRTTDGLAHPLCAVYRRTCLPSVERALERGANKVIEIFLADQLSIRWVDPDEGRFKDTDLANVNTPEDLQNLKSGAGPQSGSALNM